MIVYGLITIVNFTDCEYCCDPVSVFCEQCESYLCENCSASQHKHPKRKNHIVRQLTTATQASKGDITLSCSLSYFITA